MSFRKYHNLTAYALLACSSLMLAVSSGIAASIVMIFVIALLAAWKLEETRWRLSNRVGVGLTLLAMLLFCLGWRYQIGGGRENGA